MIIILSKSRRGVSPVIATILLVALVILGTTVIATVINNANTSSENFSDDADDQTIGQTSDTSGLEEPSISINKLTRDTSLQLQGINDFVKIEVNIVNSDARSLYIIDIDILVYGVKLDEIEQWKITQAIGASPITVNGEDAGYVQSGNSEARYTVEVEEKSNPLGRIPDNTNFKIEVFYGDEPGIISNSVQKEKISEIIFNPVFYDIAIFHHGTNWATDEAATQYEETLNGLNGTTSLFLRYDRAVDTYNYNDGPTVTYLRNNLANISQMYDIVVIDVWAVPDVIDDVLTFLHKNGTALIFYGSVNDLGNGLTEIRNAINQTATEELAGLVPNHYDPNLYPDPGGGLFSEATDNGYDFIVSNDPVLGGLSGQSYSEEELSFWTVGDDDGYDAANLTSINPTNFSVYGFAHYDFMRNDVSYWTHFGPLLTFNPGGLNGTGEVYSFVWKHNDDLGGIRATVVNPTHLNNIRKNMLTSIVGEVERTAAETADIDITSVSIIDVSNNERQFKVDIVAEVVSGTVLNDSLSFTLDMPDALDFDIWSEIFAPDGEILVNSNSITTDMPIIIEDGNVVEIDFATYFNGPLIEGDVIEILLPTGNRRFRLDAADTNLYNWTVTARYNLIQQVDEKFELRVVSPSYPLLALDANIALLDVEKLTYSTSKLV